MVNPDLLNDSDAWYEALLALPYEEQFQFIEETFELPVTDAFVSECGMDDLLSTLRSYVVPARFAALVEKIREVCPTFHRKDAFYEEPHVLGFALFHDDTNAVQKSLAYYMADPGRDLDRYLQACRWCVLYQKIDLAKELAETGMKKLSWPSDELPDLLQPLKDILVFDQWQAVYDQVQNGGPLDLGAIDEFYQGHGFTLDSDAITRVLFPDTATPNWIEPDADDKLRDGLWRFLGYAHQRYQMSFPLAALLWTNFAECLESREDAPTYERFFVPSVDEVIRFLDRFQMFLVKAEEMISATIWSLPYLADFLRTVGWIEDQSHQQWIERAKELKAAFIESEPAGLWRHDFVHRWTPPATESPDHFAEEAQLFAESIHLTAHANPSTPIGGVDADEVDRIRQLFGSIFQGPQKPVVSTSGPRPKMAKKQRSKKKSSHKKPRKRRRK